MTSRPNYSPIVDGATIRQGRLLKGWTQSALASRAGVSKRTIETAESGGRLNATSLDAIAGALGIPATEVVVQLPQPERTTRVATWEPLPADSFRTPGEAIAFARAIAEHRTSDTIRQSIALVEPWTKEGPTAGRAEAWALLADLWVRRSMVDAGSLAEIDLSLECAYRAIDLAPDYWEGHAQLALSIAVRHYDWPQADECLKQAIRLDSNAPYLTHTVSTVQTMMGRFGEAERSIRQSLSQRLGDPMSMRLNLFHVLYLARDFDASLAECRLTKALCPAAWPPDVYMALVAQARGRTMQSAGLALAGVWGQGVGEEVGELHQFVWQIKQTLREKVTAESSRLHAVRVATGGGDIGTLFRFCALGQYAKASQKFLELHRCRHPMLPYGCWMPLLDPLRQLPEVRETLLAMNLPGALDPVAFPREAPRTTG